MTKISGDKTTFYKSITFSLKTTTHLEYKFSNILTYFNFK